MKVTKKKTQKKIRKKYNKNLKSWKLKNRIFYFTPIHCCALTPSFVHRFDEKEKRKPPSFSPLSFVAHRSLRSLVVFGRSVLWSIRKIFPNPNFPASTPSGSTEPVPLWRALRRGKTSRYSTQKERKLLAHTHKHTLAPNYTYVTQQANKREKRTHSLM